MNADFLTNNLSNPATLIPAIEKEKKECFDLKQYEQIDPMKHKVHNTNLRQDKTIYIPDPTGSTDEHGNVKTIPNKVKVARISIPMQKLITSRANAFMTGGPINFKCDPETEAQQKAFAKFTDIWRKCKCDFRNVEIGHTLLSESEVVEIWHGEKDKNEVGGFKLKCTIFKPSDGYTLNPVFDSATRDLIAFGLGFKTKDTNDKDVENFHIYTKDKLYRYFRDTTNTVWTLAPDKGEVSLVYGKMPVIYYSIKKSVWADVQPMIERLETLISNFADTNDYNGSPILFAKGNIKNMSKKGEAGKLIESEGEGADLKYVTWEHAPSSIKLEIEKLTEFIFSSTQTPNLSFEALSGMGKISGAAFDRVMIDAHLKAKDMHSGAYGEGIQRRCNFIVNTVVELYSEASKGYLDISPEFELFRIDSEAERVQWVMQANGNKPIIDWEASVRKARLTAYPEKTFAKLQEETMEGAHTSFPEGSVVKVKPGMENDPSHAGVEFVVNGEDQSGMYTLTNNEATLSGSLKYPGESLLFIK